MLPAIRICALAGFLLATCPVQLLAQDNPKPPAPDAIDDFLSALKKGEVPDGFKGSIIVRKPGDKPDTQTYVNEHSEGNIRLREVFRPDPADPYSHIHYALAWPEATTRKLPVILVISAFPKWKLVDFKLLQNEAGIKDWGQDGHLREFARRNYLSAWQIMSEETIHTETGSCDPEAIAIEIDRAADKIQRFLNVLHNEPEADLKHIVIVANAAPAIAALILAERHIDGLDGVINISGGLYLRDCDPVTLNNVVTGILSSKDVTHPVPSLWLYGDNDETFDQMTVSDWRNAYMKDGGNVDLAFITMDHKPGYLLNFLPGSFLKVTLRINGFLDHLGLPAIHEAEVDKLVARLGDEKFRNLAREYLVGPSYKALAVSHSGKWVGMDFSETADIPAISSATYDCNQKSGGEGCHILMLNNEYQQ